MKKKIKAAMAAARSPVKRDLGIFFVMKILAAAFLVIAMPVILLLGLMPGANSLITNPEELRKLFKKMRNRTEPATHPFLNARNTKAP